MKPAFAAHRIDATLVCANKEPMRSTAQTNFKVFKCLVSTPPLLIVQTGGSRLKASRRSGEVALRHNLVRLTDVPAEKGAVRPTNHENNHEKSLTWTPRLPSHAWIQARQGQ